MKEIFKTLMLALLICAFAFSAHASIAVSGTYSALISDTGETLTAPGAYTDIIALRENELYAVMNGNGKYALMDEKGQLLSGAEYSSLSAMDTGILFGIGEQYGVMNDLLEIVVPCEFTWIVSNNAGGYFAFRTDIWDDFADGVYLIDESGYVSPTGVKVSSFLTPFSGRLAPALSAENGRYGYLNSDGQWAVRPQYAYAEAFENGRAIVTLDSGTGVIDENGNWLITPKYDFVDIGTGENALIAAVSYHSGITVFDKQTVKELYQLDLKIYGAYASVGGNRVYVYTNTGVCVMDETGEEVMSLPEDSYVIPGENGNMIVYTDCAYLVDAEGNQVSEKYLDISPLGIWNEKGYYVVTRYKDRIDHEIICGMIDDSGNELIPVVCHLIMMPKAGYVLYEDDAGMSLICLPDEPVWAYGF